MTVPETAMAVAKTAPCAVMIEDMVFDEKNEREVVLVFDGGN